MKLIRPTKADLARLLFAVIALLVTALLWGRGGDDAFITYRYARNLAEGHGYVYNIGERYFGLTCPLYGLLLGFLGWIFGPERIPWIASILCGASLLAAALGILQMTERRGYPIIGAVAGVLFMVNPLVHATFGMEMLLQLALAVWALDFFDRRGYLAAFTLATVAALVRPDALALIVILTVAYIWRERKLPIKPVALSASILIPSAALAFTYFGRVLPASVGAKMGQGALMGGYASGFLNFARHAFVDGNDLIPRLSNGYHFLFAPVIFGGVVMVALAMLGATQLPRYRFLWPLFAWVALKEVTYSSIGTTFYAWYAIPVLFAAAVLIGAFSARPFRYARPFAIAVVALAVIGGAVADLQRFSHPDPREQRYVAISDWLVANTEPTDRIALEEVGYVGWYSRRPILDLAGLVTQSDPKDMSWMFDHYDPKIVLFDRPLPIKWFNERYVLTSEIRFGTWAPMHIYREARTRVALK